MVQATALEYANAVEATSHADWPSRLATGAAEVASIRARGAEAGTSFTRFLLGLIRLREEERRPQRDDLEVATVAAYQALCAADPGFTWSRLSQQPYYALRAPWTGYALEAIGTWIGAFIGKEGTRDAGERNAIGDDADPMSAITSAEARWRSQLNDRPPASVSMNDEVITDIITPYRTLAESTTGEDRTAVAIREAATALVRAAEAASSPQNALARFVSHGLLARLASAPLRAQAEDGLERQRVWPDPLVEHHYRSLFENVARARTTTEVDLIAAHASACFAVEADWNILFLSSLFAPLRAACTFGTEPSAVTCENLSRAATTTYSLLGLAPQHLLTVPRVTDFMSKILVSLAPSVDTNFDAFQGEAGFDFLYEAQLWLQMARARGQSFAINPAWSDSILEFCHDAGIAAHALPMPVKLWETLIAPENLVRELARPQRPLIPGITF
jgi:hypothetical protein